MTPSSRSFSEKLIELVRTVEVEENRERKAELDGEGMSCKVNEAILCQVPLIHSGEFSSDDIDLILRHVQDLVVETLPTAVACSRILVLAHDGMLADLRGFDKLGGGAWRKHLRYLRELFFVGSLGLNLNIRRHFGELSEIITEILDDHALSASKFSYDDVKRNVHFHAEDRATHSLWFLLSFRPLDASFRSAPDLGLLYGTCCNVANLVQTKISERGFQWVSRVYGMKVNADVDLSPLQRTKEIVGLGLRKIAVECLQSSGVHFLEDMCYLTREELLRVPYFGAKSMDIVVASLRTSGLTMLSSSAYDAYPGIFMVSLPDGETYLGSINPGVVRFFASNGWEIKPLEEPVFLEN